MEKEEIKRQEGGRIWPIEEKQRLEDTKERQIRDLRERLQRERKRGGRELPKPSESVCSYGG